MFLTQIKGVHREVVTILSRTDDLENGQPVECGDYSDRNERELTSSGLPGNDKLKDDSYANVPCIEQKINDDASKIYIVSWNSPHDPKNPRNWPYPKKIRTTLILLSICFLVTMASSIDSTIVVPAANKFGVSIVTETLSGTAMYLIGFGAGSLFSSPLSELFGRYPVYVGTLVIFGCWTVGAALSPNIGAQIAFRGLAGICASAPLTVAGGSLADLYNSKELTWALPVFAIGGFGGPLLGPVIGAWIGYDATHDHHLTWEWTEWVTLILDGIVLCLTLAVKEETLGSRLLLYKAHYFRRLTGDSRFKAKAELEFDGQREMLFRYFARPFVLAMEPIVIAFTVYLTIVYIILFTFLDGFTYIFSETYHINSGMTNSIFAALFVGVLIQFMTVPLIYQHTKMQLKRDGDPGDGSHIQRESRLLFAMIGAPTIPIGLFWMAWTDYPHISIWAPICSCLFVGFGIVSIFLSTYMYIIDSYQMFAASALTFNSLVRYLAAGGMTVVGVPFYKNLGTHYTLSILACISVAALPIPYVMYKWGPKLRAKSKFAVDHGT